MGVAIDADGFVWVVDVAAHKAFKVDPTSRQVVATTTNLVLPYSYSDLTGGALRLVAGTVR